MTPDEYNFQLKKVKQIQEQMTAKANSDYKKVTERTEQKKEAMARLPRITCDVAGKGFAQECDELTAFYEE